jgi:protein phosphatase
MGGTVSRLRFSGRTDVGRRRTTNQDTYRIDPELGFCLVADGIGGAAAGDRASHFFSDAAAKVFDRHPERSEKSLFQTVQEVFNLANTWILEHVNRYPGHKGMGSTAELLAFSTDGFVLGHMGDSRTYRLRNGVLKQITQDHSLVQQQIDQGIISAEEARRHPLRHVILRAVGIDEQLALDVIRGQILHEDLFLLCSDGLSSMVEHRFIARTLQSANDLDRKVELLVQAALSAGGYDNITVVLVEII